MQQLDYQFRHCLSKNQPAATKLQKYVMIRYLELRRRFLMQGNVTQKEQQFVIPHIPTFYDINSTHMRALALLAFISVVREHAFALIFCYSRQALKYLLNRL